MKHHIEETKDPKETCKFWMILCLLPLEAVFNPYVATILLWSSIIGLMLWLFG